MGKAFLWAVKLLVREIRDCKQVVKDAIDTYRFAHGMAPLYQADQRDEPMPESPTGALVGQGDYLTRWMLEELAHEHIGRVTPDMDLEREARERGWVDDEGKFVMLPQSMLGMTLENADFLPLLSEKALGRA